MFYNVKLIILLFLFCSKLIGQEAATDRLINNELKMVFPCIYFKHLSTDYAAMPYTVDSCLMHIAQNFSDNINSLVIWRDSAETEALTSKRIQKLRLGLRKYIKSSLPEIYSMDAQQKVARYTIRQTNDNKQINYLLTLNSVFEISKTRLSATVKSNNHLMNPSITCWGCWKSGFHLQTRMKFKKMERERNKK